MYAYDLASRKSKKSSARQKKHYDSKVRGAIPKIGDRVLVRKVGLTGKHKLEDRWEESVFVVLEQPKADLPVFVVQQEDGKGRLRTLHRNLLLPLSLPLDSRIPTLRKDHEVSAPSNVPELPDTEVTPGSSSSSNSDDDAGYQLTIDLPEADDAAEAERSNAESDAESSHSEVSQASSPSRESEPQEEPVPLRRSARNRRPPHNYVFSLHSDRARTTEKRKPTDLIKLFFDSQAHLFQLLLRACEGKHRRK